MKKYNYFLKFEKKRTHILKCGGSQLKKETVAVDSLRCWLLKLMKRKFCARNDIKIIYILMKTTEQQKTCAEE